MAMLKWVFFDVGDVLINEDRLRFNLFRILRELMSGTSFEALFSQREQLIRENADPSPHYTIARQNLTEAVFQNWQSQVTRFAYQNRDEMLILMPGMVDLLKKLADRFHLGIVANQPEWIERYLDEAGVLSFFETVCISEAVKLCKPHPGIFELAMEKSGCSPGECVMIGDRLDNDIVPARKLGWRTIWLNLPPREKGWEPQSAEERLYLDSLEKIGNWNSGSEAGPETGPKIQSLEQVYSQLM